MLVSYLKMTERQERVLEFIKSYLVSHQSTPTRVAIAEHFKFLPNAADEHLKALLKKGEIEKMSSGVKKSNYRLTKFKVVLVEKEK